jgi:hypothetical protein
LSRGLNWERAAQRDLVRDRGQVRVSRSFKRSRRRNITRAQAKRLRWLRKRQKRPYDGAGMSYGQAQQAINEAVAIEDPRPPWEVRRAKYAQLSAAKQAALRAEFYARQEGRDI